tara:strand:- start:88 stop:369 length:282 start_codon:yes stop_codon:yes gene_type:complete
MAYKQKGMDFGNSPLTKKAGPEPKKFDIDDQIALSEHEDKKGTMITGGSKSEEINDLEDRIEFLKNDVKDGNMDPKVKVQLKKLQTRLTKMEG